MLSSGGGRCARRGRGVREMATLGSCRGHSTDLDAYEVTLNLRLNFAVCRTACSTTMLMSSE